MLKYGSDYVRYRLTGDESYLVQGFHPLFESVRYNVPLLTSEVLVTDRVYVHGAEHLKAMLTGDGINESASPYYAVSYEDTRETMTALVKSSSAKHLNVSLYSFEKESYPVQLRLWQLDPGEYVLIKESQGEKERKTFAVKDKGQRVSLTLPGLTLCQITISSYSDQNLQRESE